MTITIAYTRILSISNNMGGAYAGSGGYAGGVATRVVVIMQG